MFMPQTTINVLEKPSLKNPVFIEGLPGVGYIGRNVAGYMIEQLGAKKFAELHSPNFPPVVLMDHNKTGKIIELKNEFYYWKAEKKGQRDLIILIGDTQSASPKGHYDVVEKILSLIKDFGVKEMITLGGFGTGKLVDKETSVFGASLQDEKIAEFEKLGVQFKDTSIGQIIGASGLLLSEGSHIGIRGVCLMGETSGMLLSDPKSTEAVLGVLMKHLNLRIDLSRIEEKVKETERVIKKIEALQKKLSESPQEKEKGEETSYIG